MKTILAAIALTSLAATASATDLTANFGRSYGNDTNNGSLVLGANDGALRGELSVARSNQGKHNTVYGADVGLTSSYFSNLKVTPKIGVTYMDTDKVRDGFGVKAGVEAALALTDKVSLVGEVGHVQNQSKIRALGGNYTTVGVRYSF